MGMSLLFLRRELLLEISRRIISQSLLMGFPIIRATVFTTNTHPGGMWLFLSPE